jgi:hypothetical protein
MSILNHQKLPRGYKMVFVDLLIDGKLIWTYEFSGTLDYVDIIAEHQKCALDDGLIGLHQIENAEFRLRPRVGQGVLF